ncbi:hypothetical protein C0J52_24798 [Blattella germanica]|nr:hypothetical protein C0J52_24798 [Blattella germanica]
MHQWLRNQDHEFYHTGIHALVKRWIKTVEKDGDYIENLLCSVATVVAVNNPPYMKNNFIAPNDIHNHFPMRLVKGEAMHQWLRNQDHEFYHTGIHALVKRWIKTVEKDGDYIEK